MTNAQLHGCLFEGWQCFFCGEIFTTVGAAQDHFGGTPNALAGCQIKFGEERGLLMELRKAESENAALTEQLKQLNEQLETSQYKLGYVKQQALLDADTIATLQSHAATMPILLGYTPPQSIDAVVNVDFDNPTFDGVTINVVKTRLVGDCASIYYKLTDGNERNE